MDGVHSLSDEGYRGRAIQACQTPHDEQPGGVCGYQRQTGTVVIVGLHTNDIVEDYGIGTFARHGERRDRAKERQPVLGTF